MDIRQSTAAYEKWLARQLRIVPGDLKLKHQNMAEDEFSFFRATFYRWMQLWPETCPALLKAPKVLACGDLHIENFGTWRDAEGRLVWGVNDFDEAFLLPYTQDLCRLATSAQLANLTIGCTESCAAILDGYRDGLKDGGRPVILADHHVWLREAAWNELRDPIKFWNKLRGLPAWRGKIPGTAERGLLKALPGRAKDVKYLHRTSGLGSLGRQRIVALTEWNGGSVAREAKASAPSACLFATQSKGTRSYSEDLADCAVRAIDPCLHLTDRWIFRRLSPDCCRIELSSLRRVHEQVKLLYVMGYETANLHLGSAKAVPKIVKHLAQLPPGWLDESASAMTRSFRAEFKDWRKPKRKAAKA